MNSQQFLFRIILFLVASLLYACSSGPAEKIQPDSLTSPAIQLDKGIYHYSNNNYPKAIEHFEKSLLQYRSIDNQKGIAQSCMNLSKAYMATSNNKIAAQYLAVANKIIKQASLIKLEEHLHLLLSSLAINNADYDTAIQELATVLNSQNKTTQLAALKNRTRIAFLQNQSDKSEWLNKYKMLQQKHPENTSSHLARVLRFEAELSSDDNNKTDLLKQSLSLSGKMADRTAIAAVLSQWAETDSQKKRYTHAEDKYLRALFIRHQLGDVKNSRLILIQLQKVYVATDNDKQKQTTNWINKISNRDLSGWDQLFLEFETYPIAP